MSQQPMQTPAAPRPEAPALFPVTRSWKVATTVGIIMVVLALLGVGLTTSGSTAAPTYWIALVPIFGLLCIATAWARGRGNREISFTAVLRQVLHWVGIGGALGLDFMIRGMGEESGAAAGLNALLVLALGCYLAGVHLDWMFILVGLLLTLTLILVTKSEQYVWVIFVAGGVAIVGLFLLQRFFGGQHKAA